MTGAMIAQLLIVLGPTALKLIEDLVNVWSTPMTPEQVVEFCRAHRKSYDEYIAEARAAAAIK